MVKFIHAADLHMDRSFEGLTTLDKTVQEKTIEDESDRFIKYH